MFLSRKTTTGVICVLALSASGARVWAGQNGSEVVAEIGGKAITRAELEQKKSADLLSARYKFYQSERQALDDLIDEELLQQQAEREHVSVDELLKRHVTDTVQVDLTEDQLRVFYEGLRTDEPYEVMRDKIIESLREKRTANARIRYLKMLHEQASAKVMLAPPLMDVKVGDAPVRGDKNAPVMLVEFADYQCPYCKKIYPELRLLEQQFKGNVAFVFKDFPLDMHKYALKAAEAARCAGAQGKYWQYHDLLFQNEELDKEQLKQYARDLSLDQARFNTCLDSGQEAAAVQKDVEEGKALGIAQTPGFFVNGHFFNGAVPYATLRDLVQQQLTAATGKSAEASTRAAR